MNQLDVYYRALLNYRKLTTANHECSQVCSAIAQADAERDKITVKRAFCTIDDDWVNAIEAGLVHVEKAIKEDRQFIRSNGEVVPIEKVKRISKETTQHLAKHSNLITRYEEGEDIVPDKLYMIERLNDYAVYENRFLYMLLCYLRDFVTLRYNKILDLTHKYDAEVSINKTISSGKHKMKYTMSMHDLRRDDPYLKENNPARDIIDRIDLILKAVLAFLATPLMSEVSKAPMLKPPITKTNVLKMNNNFKGAMALYEFVVSYDKPGYTVEEKETLISPFGDELSEEMSEAAALISFLTYEYGLGMKKELKEAYLREEELIKVQKIKERAERIEALKRKLQKTGEGLEDYILTLEKQLRALEGEAARAEALFLENVELQETKKRLTETIEGLEKDLEAEKIKLEEEKQRHFEEVEALKKAHEEAMHALIVKHEEELARIEEERRLERERYEEELRLQKERHEEELARIAEERRLEEEKHKEELARIAEERRLEEEKHRQELDDVRENARKTIEENEAKCNEALGKAQSETDAAKQESEQYKKKNEELIESARVDAARIKVLGGLDRDYTDRDSFSELEKEYNAFTRIYKEQWDKTKKRIRKKHLNMENFRGQNEQDKSSD